MRTVYTVRVRVSLGRRECVGRPCRRCAHALKLCLARRFLIPSHQGFDDIAEGRARPGHFRGVATVVTKLLNIVQPTRAYFGQKDAAQCVLIRRIVDDLNMDVQCVIMDTVREPDGLAMSSRNSYLTPNERAAAPVVHRSLCAARDLFCRSIVDSSNTPAAAGGAIEAHALREAVLEVLRSEPLVREVQYVAVDSKETMRPLQQVTAGEGAIISIACKVGSVRLIDNIVL
jgi:pantoate--beta-alanine ligase